jgi:hypothetical protein
MSPSLHQDLRIRIFFSSPGDVEKEREIARDVLEELQRLHGEEMGVNLIYKGWETDTYPAIGRPQGVINQQIGEYEIFVGVFWSRYGTPTGEAESGTVEEFERALESRDQDDIPAVLFYFRQTPVELETIEELEQKIEVVRFRKQYGERAGLYETYTDVDEFKEKLRYGLLQTIRRVHSQRISSGGEAVDSSVREASESYAVPVDAMEPEEFVFESLEVVAEDFESFAQIDLDDDVSVEIDWEDSRQAFTAAIYKGDEVVNKCRIAKSEHRRQYHLVCMIGAKAARAARGQPEVVRAHITKQHNQLCFEVSSQNLDPPEENIDGHELAQYLWNALTSPLEYHSPVRALVGAFQWTSQ